MFMFRVTILRAVAVIAVSATMALSAEFPKLSPFTKVTIDEDKPLVEYGGKTYELVSINDIPAAKILTFCRERYRQIWEKRFAEDLVEVMTLMDQPPEVSVKLVLRDPMTGGSLTVPNAPMTEENRRSVYRHRHAARGADGTPGPTEPEQALTPQQATAALDELERALEEQWSYRHASDADFEAAIARVRKKAASGLTGNELRLEMHKIIAMGIDGHARGPRFDLAPQRLPFLVEPIADQFVAVRTDRSGLLDNGYPYLAALDGRDIGDWLKAAEPLVAKGSPQYVRYGKLRWLDHVAFLRGQLRLPRRDVVSVELISADGNNRKLFDMPLSHASGPGTLWPAGESRLLEPDNVGYLRIGEMDGDAVTQVRQSMERFRHTRWLIVDVRGNGGGQREVLRLLASYLLSPDDAPRVANCARHLRNREDAREAMAGRGLYPESDETWTDAERQAIAEFKQRFTPQVNLPDDKFSDWHYMVLSRLGDPTIYHYDKPVMMLIDGRCFSATDVFLAAFKGWPGVTLIGTPSAGGSAASRTIRLGQTSLDVRLGSMASFQPTGKLFDGNGVHPDVLVEPAPGDFVAGGADSALEKALELIQRSSQ